MAVAKLKYPKEDRLERLADRVANEINARAAKMTPEDRPKPIQKLQRLLLKCDVELLNCRNCCLDFPLQMKPNAESVGPRLDPSTDPKLRSQK